MPRVSPGGPRGRDVHHDDVPLPAVELDDAAADLVERGIASVSPERHRRRCGGAAALAPDPLVDLLHDQFNLVSVRAVGGAEEARPRLASSAGPLSSTGGWWRGGPFRRPGAARREL